MLLSFLNGILPEDLNDGVKVFLHIIVLLHLFAFATYGVMLARDLCKSPESIAKEKLHNLEKKIQ